MIPTLLADLVAASVNESISNVLGNGRLAGNMSGSVREIESQVPLPLSNRHVLEACSNPCKYCRLCKHLCISANISYYSRSGWVKHFSYSL